jgi:hypothetical protein
MLPLETNILRKDYIRRYLETHTPKLLADDLPKFTLEVKVYDSVKRTLLQVLRLRNDNTLMDLADAILCNVCKLEGLKYQRFFFLEKEIYREINQKLSLIDMSGDIIEKFNADSGGEAKIFQGGFGTRICDLIKLKIGKVYIFRDQPKCDHMVVFTNLEIGSSIDGLDKKDFPFDVYEAKVKRRHCGACGDGFARYVTRKDKLTKESLSFFCQECFMDLHTVDGENIKGDTEWYGYIFE